MDNFGFYYQLAMDQHQISKIIIYAGLFLLFIGVGYYFFGDKFRWIGNLPGDIRIEKDSFKFYFPLTTMIILSLMVNLIIWLIRNLF